jgi:hypothetical protein
VLFHIPDNGVLAFFVAIPLLESRVYVLWGDFTLTLPRRGRYRKSGGLIALRYPLYLLLLGREKA